MGGELGRVAGGRAVGLCRRARNNGTTSSLADGCCYCPALADRAAPAMADLGGAQYFSMSEWD